MGIIDVFVDLGLKVKLNVSNGSRINNAQGITRIPILFYTYKEYDDSHVDFGENTKRNFSS